MASETGKLGIPARGTRGRRVTNVFFKLLKPLAAGQISRYRNKASAKPPKMGRVPLVLLTTVGASTGRERTTVLGGFDEEDGSWLVVGSNSGSPSHPSCFINLAKNPEQVWLEIGSRKLHVRPELIKDDEYEAAYRRIVADSPQYAGHRKVARPRDPRRSPDADFVTSTAWRGAPCCCTSP